MYFIPAGVLVILVTCWNGGTFGQTPDQKHIRSTNIPEAVARMSPQERQRLYERYFREVCETDNVCNDTCKSVFEKLERKDKTNLKCSP